MKSDLLKEAINSIEKHLEVLREDHPTTVLKPSKSKLHSRKFLYQCVKCFFELANDRHFYHFWEPTDFLGICLLLEPQEPVQAKLMPYLLTAYMYNCRHNEMVSSYMEVVSKTENQKIKKALDCDESLYGLNLENYPQQNDIHNGIGALYDENATDEDLDSLIETLPGFFRFYTENDFKNDSNSAYKKLKMIKWEDGKLRYPDIIAPDEPCIRRDLKRLPKVEQPADHRPRAMMEEGYSYYRRDVILRTIRLWYEAMWTICSKKKFRSRTYIIERPDPELIEKVLSPIITWREEPTVSPRKIKKNEVATGRRYPAAILPEDIHQTNWPIFIDVSKLGFACRSCMILPYFGNSAKKLARLRSYQMKYEANYRGPVVNIKGICNNISIRFHINTGDANRNKNQVKDEYEQVKKSSDFTKYRKGNSYPETHCRFMWDAYVDFKDVEKPDGTDYHLKFKLHKLYYGHSWMHLFLFFDLMDEDINILSTIVESNPQDGPNCDIKVIQTGVVTIQIWPCSVTDFKPYNKIFVPNNKLVDPWSEWIEWTDGQTDE